MAGVVASASGEQDWEKDQDQGQDLGDRQEDRW